MMPPFGGFSENKTRTTSIPGQFFSELLPAIDHLGELKVTLYLLWRFDHMEGTFRYLQRSDFVQDERFISGMGETTEETEALLDESLKKAVARGTLLLAGVNLDGKEVGLYFLNSPKGEAAVRAINNGQWRHTGKIHAPVELIQETPNIFRLYEEHIGPLTPMIAEALGEAEDTYPPIWIEEAVRIAVENNKRSWRYVEAILERWQQEGRDERKDKRYAEKNGREYIEGKYSDFIEH
jgi:DnaD/phage-associated family protein